MKRRQRRVTYEIGQRYHSFTISNIAPRITSKHGRFYTAWECQCDCGKKFVTTTKQIQKGIRKSCGCISKSNRFKKLDGKTVVGGVKFGHYRNSAQRRKILWELKKDDFLSLIFQNCHYCGLPPSILVKSRSHAEKVNGIDRVDNSIGYVLSNCVSCCRFCNMAKGAATVKEFLEWVDLLRNTHPQHP